MSNLVTLTQDEIERFNLKGKKVGDAITAEEYSKHQKEFETNRDKTSSTEDETDKKTSKK